MSLSTFFEHYSRPSLIKTLRLTTILTFPPTFGLLLAHAIVGNRAEKLFPTLGIIPAFFSSLFGAQQLLAARKKRYEYEIVPSDEGVDGDRRRETRRVPAGIAVAIADFVLAPSFLVVLVFSWISFGRRDFNAVLAAYGTVGLIVNWLIHSYLVILHLVHFAMNMASPWLPDLPRTESSDEAGPRHLGQKPYMSLYRDDSPRVSSSSTASLPLPDVETKGKQREVSEVD